MRRLVYLSVALLLLCSLARADNEKPSRRNVSNPRLLQELLEDWFAGFDDGWFLFDPQSSAPLAAEGKVYYSDSANALYLYNGSAWTVIDAGSGDSLGTAYSAGSKIDADTDVVEIEVADAANNSALLIDHDEATNDNPAVVITNAADASTAVSIQIDGTAGYDLQGTGDTWEISTAGLLTTSGGFTIEAADCLFDDTYDVAWDTSRDQLLFEDNAVLGIGGAHDAAGDVTFKWDASNLLIEAATDNTGQIRLGSTNSMDFVVYGSTNSNTVLFDVSGSLLTTNGWKVNIQDDDDLTFGDSDEFKIEYDEDDTDNLFIVATNANDAVQIGDGTTATDLILQSTADAAAQVQFDASGDTANGQMLFGADDHGIDVIFYGATASQKAWWDQSGDTWYFGADAEGVDVYFYGDTTVNNVMWDESQDRMEWTAADILLDDNSDLLFGSDSDWKIESDTAKTLELIPGSTTDESAAIIVGATTAGADLKIWGATGGDYMEFDASADALNMVSINIVVSDSAAVTGDGTGALGGFLKTVTDDTNGKTLAVTESGTVQTNAGAGGAAAWTLPAAAAGLEYTFVVMAAQELRVTPGAGDVITINSVSAAAAEYWTANAVGEYLHLIAVDATNWIAVGYGGTWTEASP